MLGFWAVSYTCNTETAACKGAEPWPGASGFLYGAGWVVGAVGIALIVTAPQTAPDHGSTEASRSSRTHDCHLLWPSSSSARVPW